MFRWFLLTDLAPIKALSKALTSLDREIKSIKFIIKKAH